jgi:hypothetical protein
MAVDRRLERLYERVTLVEGIGRPRRSKLCVMSFVALLAGERHTDQPASASPLIGNLAIPLNDAMPLKERQRLKPFAARILGSNDGRDRARAEVLRRTLAEEILPRIRRDLGAGRVPGGRRAPLGFLFANAVGRDLEARAALLLARLELLLARPEHGIPPGPEGAIGSAAGELLALCMRAATTRERRAWYREEAIGLLDRLCGVGRETRGPAVREDGIARAEERLGDGGTWLGGIRRSLLRSAWQVRRLETGRTDAAPEASRPSAVRPGPPVDGGTAHRGAVGHDVPYERARDRRDQIRHRPVEAALEREGP